MHGSSTSQLGGEITHKTVLIPASPPYSFITAVLTSLLSLLTASLGPLAAVHFCRSWQYSFASPNASTSIWIVTFSIRLFSGHMCSLMSRELAGNGYPQDNTWRPNTSLMMCIYSALRTLDEFTPWPPRITFAVASAPLGRGQSLPSVAGVTGTAALPLNHPDRDALTSLMSRLWQGSLWELTASEPLRGRIINMQPACLWKMVSAYLAAKDNQINTQSDSINTALRRQMPLNMKLCATDHFGSQGSWLVHKPVFL